MWNQIVKDPTILTVIDWYGNQRRQILQTETLEALEICTNYPTISSTISFSAPPTHELFIERLKEHYRTLSTLPIFTPQMNGELECEIPLESLYTHLAMIGDDERKERKEGQTSIEDGKLPTYERSVTDLDFPPHLL